MAKPSQATSSQTDHLPRLELLGPNGQQATFLLEHERTTIGRLSECNDIALDPDPLQLVSRQVHCVVERERGAWWVLDNGSVNGTLVQRGEEVKVVHGRLGLEDGDEIKVLGLLSDAGEPAYWTLRFVDPLKTRPAGLLRAQQALEYDMVQAKLFLTSDAASTEIALAAMEHKLIRYMTRRNSSNGKVPVMCTHEELITAVWGDRRADRTDLTHLVFQIRKKLPGSDGARFLEAERGMGYRLLNTL